MGKVTHVRTLALVEKASKADAKAPKIYLFSNLFSYDPGLRCHFDDDQFRHSNNDRLSRDFSIRIKVYRTANGKRT